MRTPSDDRLCYETLFYEHLQEALASISVTRYRVCLDQVDLVRESSTTYASILFRVAERAGCRFGKKLTVWSGGAPSDDLSPTDSARLAVTVLEEDLDAADRGLPTDCSEDAVNWV